MTVEVKVPEVGESITEVEIGDWLKAVGESVQRDEDLVVIETDKATVEILAPQAGRLTKILKASGETAQVGEVIGHLDEIQDKKADGAGEDQTSVAESAKLKNQRGVEPKQPSRSSLSAPANLIPTMCWMRNPAMWAPLQVPSSRRRNKTSKIPRRDQAKPMKSR
jgi:2-oxoglutarate dehydrogenase E2 component (dihydrolipoamide succinyltransferase)